MQSMYPTAPANSFKQKKIYKEHYDKKVKIFTHTHTHTHTHKATQSNKQPPRQKDNYNLERFRLFDCLPVSYFEGTKLEVRQEYFICFFSLMALSSVSFKFLFIEHKKNLFSFFFCLGFERGDYFSHIDSLLKTKIWRERYKIQNIRYNGFSFPWCLLTKE